MKKLLSGNICSCITGARRLRGILTTFFAVAAVAGIIARILIRLLSRLIRTAVGCHHLTDTGILRCSRCHIVDNRVERYQKYRNNK